MEKLGTVFSLLVLVGVAGNAIEGASQPTARSSICPNVAELIVPGLRPEATGEIAGEVYSVEGAPLPGVQVWVGERSEKGFRGTLTNQEGSFGLTRVPPGEYVLQFQYIGYGAQDHQVVVVSGRTEVVCAVLSGLSSPIEF